jgi:hypothetical protein
VSKINDNATPLASGKTQNLAGRVFWLLSQDQSSEQTNGANAQLPVMLIIASWLAAQDYERKDNDK